MEYDRLEPFGDQRSNWHAAVIAQILAAVHTPKNRKPPSVVDFMWRDPVRRREDEERKLFNWLKAMKNG